MLVAVVVLQAVIVVGLGIAALFFKAYLPSYLTEKGKNLATKEDIEGITRQVEHVKAALGTRLHISQLRYRQEFRILQQLSEHLVTIRDSAVLLRPETDFINADDPEERKKRIGRYFDAARALYQVMETRQPFYPREIYVALKALDQEAWKEVVQYKHQDPKRDAKYWENALENGARINTLATVALERIRERVHRWEQFDPGP